MTKEEISNLKIGDYISWISDDCLDCSLTEIINICIEGNRIWFTTKWHYCSYDITNPDDNMLDDIYLLNAEFSIPDKQTIHYYQKLMVFK